MKPHDFDGPVDKTSVELMKKFIGLFNDKKEDLIQGDDKDDAAKEKLDEDMNNFLESYIKEISQTDLPADYAAYPIEKFIAILTVLKNMVEGTVRQHEDEILSRVIGVKNPNTETYAKDIATYGELVLKLKEIRESTGNNLDDYFIKVKKKK